MLVAGPGLEIGDVAGFELIGSGYHRGGVAKVMHRMNGGFGSCDGTRPRDDKPRARLRRRIGRQRARSGACSAPGEYLG